ncbi:hypothetical protein [Micromonospora sp. NPDC002717]|uniref:hypothetical protein n=1 Tax=Micromonospora sp. NPDC002717 TaxID=3154424 RepID=UPI00331FBCB2
MSMIAVRVMVGAAVMMNRRMTGLSRQVIEGLAGLVDLLLHAPLQVQDLAGAGHQALGAETRGAVITPRPKPRKRQTSLPASVAAAHDAARRRHPSQRIRVEHVTGHLKNWRILGRHHGRRENFDATIRAIAGLLSDHQHNDRTEHTARPLKALPARPKAGEGSSSPRVMSRPTVHGSLSMPG